MDLLSTAASQGFPLQPDGPAVRWPISTSLVSSNLPESTSSSLIVASAPTLPPSLTVITLCIEGDITGFNTARETKLRKVLAVLLSDEMTHSNIRITKVPLSDLTKKDAAKIGTGRCRLRVEVDREGYARYSSDSSSSGSSTEDTCSEVDPLDAIESHVEVMKTSLHWPKTVEVKDMQVVWKAASCVLVVLLVPDAMAHVLFQLVEQSILQPKKRIQEVEDEGVYGCKLGELIVFADSRQRIAHEDAMRAAEAHPEVMRAKLEAELKSNPAAPQAATAEQSGESKKRRLQSAIPEPKLEPRLEPMPASVPLEKYNKLNPAASVLAEVLERIRQGCTQVHLNGACSGALPLTLRSCTLEKGACGAPPERAPHTPSPRPRPVRPACRRQ